MRQANIETSERSDDPPRRRDVEYWLCVSKSIEECRPGIDWSSKRSNPDSGINTRGDYLTTGDELTESAKKNTWYPCGDCFKRFTRDEVAMEGISWTLTRQHPSGSRGYTREHASSASCISSLLMSYGKIHRQNRTQCFHTADGP